MTTIELRDVRKHFGATRVFADLTLSIPSGSITAVLGASGSGKTTLLRLIAGLETVDGGSITIGGRLVDDGRRSVHPQHRGAGYVPQDGALFPHLSVLDNVSFGLRRGADGQAATLVDLVGLRGLEDRLPHQLSGGQQQRVALARALAIGPTVVLLDEPFGSLDATLRVSLRRDVVRILRETATTTVLVTHDQNEALATADQVAVLRDGRAAAVDAPRRLYRDPPDIATAQDIGDANILTADARGGRAHCALGTIALREGVIPQRDGPARVLVRPEQLVLHLTASEGGVRATVADVQFFGHDTLVTVTLEPPAQGTVLVRATDELEFLSDQPVWVQVVGPGRAWPIEAEGPPP